MTKKKWRLYQKSKKLKSGQVRGRGDESDDNEFVESKSKAAANKFQATRGI